MEIKEVQKTIQNRCAEFGYLSIHARGNIFYKQSEIALDKIGFSVDYDDLNKDVIIQFWLEKRLHFIEKRWDGLRYLIGLQNQPPPLTLAYVKGGVTKVDTEIIDTLRLFKIAAKDNFYVNFNDTLNNILVSSNAFFKRFDSVHNLNALLNKPIHRYEDVFYVANPHGLAFRKIIISALVENPRHEELCSIMLDRLMRSSASVGSLKIYNELMKTL